jgi:uncharacterized protein YndB with AHSA1/START domain
MSDPDPERDAEHDYVFETDVDAAPETLWRAISEPALREAWLPEAGEVVASRPPEELTLRCDEQAPAGLVTFTVAPSGEGGARLTIVHRREAEVIPLEARRPAAVRMRMAA